MNESYNNVPRTLNLKHLVYCLLCVHQKIVCMSTIYNLNEHFYPLEKLQMVMIKAMRCEYPGSRLSHNSDEQEAEILFTTLQPSSSQNHCCKQHGHKRMIFLSDQSTIPLLSAPYVAFCSSDSNNNTKIKLKIKYRNDLRVQCKSYKLFLNK